MTAIYELENVQKIVSAPSGPLEILSGVSLAVGEGETAAILGASGSGKSTLLHIMGALDEPTGGRILFGGRDLAKLGSGEKARLRNREIGFVFQFHHLLPEFTTSENVAMQALLSGMPRRKALALAEDALEKVGLAERGGYDVTTLSGGERQRAAIARAILLSPRVLLADEPTGNLDGRNGDSIADLLLKLNRERSMTLVMVTHNREMAARMQRCFELRSGVLYEENIR